MAGKTYTQKIRFQGSFDGKQVLDGLKQIRQQMGKAGAETSLFKGVDKDIAATEKLINDILAQIQKGFSNSKEITAFGKQFEKLGLSLSKINVGLQDINQKANLNLNAGDIQKYTKEINKLKSAQEDLAQSAKDSVAAQAKGLGANKAEIRQIQDEVKANGDLEQAIKKVAQAKEKEAKAKYGQRAVQTQEGKDLIKNSSKGINIDDLEVSALSGTVKRGKNDARQRTASGRLSRSQGQPLIDIDKAQVALTEGYAKALTEVMQNGGDAADAVKILKEHMEEYGVEIKEAEQLQESFLKDIDSFETAVPKTSGEKSAITKATKMGRTDSAGSFSLSQGAQDLIKSNPELQAYMQNLQETQRLQEILNQTTREGSNAQDTFAQRLGQAAQSQEQLENAGKETTDSLKEQSEIAEDIDNKFNDLKSSVKTFLSIGSAVSGLKNVLEDTFNDIKELDKSFAEIAMVTDYSVQEMWNSYDQYAQMANELGQSTQSVIQASGLFYQQGLQTKEALELTEDTMKLATLAGLDFEKATSQMTAALRGFHMEMDQGSRVTDVYSELAAKAAADVEGIAYAMSKTASIASSAGMEFETTSAFLTQMIETTQEAPENIGTAMKTIIARFTELKENVAGTADSEFEDLDYNKVDTALKSVGVSIKDASGQFRDLDEVFLELSGKWNTLDRNSQRYIATIAAGSRQQSRFIAMMENYDRTLELVDTAYDSTGKSSEQFAKYQDTVEYKLNQLKNTWEQFRTQFFNSDFFKGALDGFNALLGKINELSGGDLLALGAAVVVLGKTLGVSLISGIQTAVKKVPKMINEKLNKAFNNNTIDVSADISQADEKLKELKQEQEALERGLANLKADVSIIQAKEKLEELNEEMSKGPLKSEDYKEQEKLNKDIETNEKKQNALKNKLSENLQGQKDEEQNKKNLEAQKQLAEKDFSEIGQAAAVAFSAAFVAISTDMDPGAAVATTLGTGLTSIMPTVIADMSAAWATAGTTSGASFLTTFIASSGGIMLIVVAAIAAITGLVALTRSLDAQEEAKQFDKRYAEAKKLAEESKKQAEEQRSEAKKATEEADSAKELKERYEELHNQTVRTVEEQEEYNELVLQIQEQFPQIITNYNEITGELEVQNDLWDKIIEKSEILAKQERKEANVAELTAINDQLVVDEMTTIKDNFENMDIFANSDAAKENLNEFEKFVEGEMNFDDTNMSRALQQISNEGIATQIKEDSDTNYDKITNTDRLIAAGITAGANVLAPVAGIFTAGTAMSVGMESQRQQNDKALAALDYNAVADFIGYKDDKGVLEFDSEGNATIVDEFGNVIEATKTDLEEFQKAVLDSENGLEAQIEKQKELINQEQELAEKQAALTYATQYISDYEQGLGEELAAGQKEFMTGVIANMTDEFDGAAEDYMKTGNNTFFDALGGAWDGPSDNSLSDWEDINGENVIEGIDEELLKQAGFEGEFTGNDVKALLTDIKGSEEEAAKFWEENQGTAAGQLAIQNAILASLKTKGNNQILADLDSIDWTEVNSSYDQMLKDGATQEEINAYNDAIAAQQQAALDRGQDDLAGWIGDYGQDTLEKYNKIFDEAEASFTNLNKMGELTTEHLEVFTQQAQNVEDILGNHQLGLDYVNQMNQLMMDSGITDPSTITNALSSFDVSTITAFNQDEIKQQFIDSMSESMNSEEAGQLWEQFFALSEDYNLINVEIGSVDVLKQGLNESYDKMAEQISGASGIKDAITAQLENGFLNFSQSNELRKTLEEAGLNFEDYFVFDESGNSFIDFDKIKKDYEKLVPTAEDFKQQALDSLDAAIQEIDLQIDMISALQSETDQNYKTLKVKEATTQELKTQLAYMEEMGYLTVGKDFYEKIEGIGEIKISEDDIKLSKEGEDIIADLKEQRKNYEKQITEIESGKYTKVYEEMTEKELEELKAIFNTTEELEEKEKDLTDATEELTKAQKEYDEALHGTAEWLDSQDPFKALSDSISILEKKLEGLKEELNNVTNPEQSKDILNAITANRTTQIENLKGQMQVSQSQYDQAQDFIKNGDYSEYYSQLPDGTVAFDITKWYDEGGSDEIGDALGDMATKSNDAAMNILESQQKINSIQEEQEKESEERLKNYTSLQDQILEILKKNAEEEVKTQKEKYENLKQADNDYLSALEEAIEKQRQLREQERAYEDLATKEKKLSLMQRDTSGANQKEINELQKEVEEQRQDLLDSKVDEMINNLKTQTELQTELRDMEIEIKEAELENKNYLSELAAVESSFHNTDDIVAWMLENNKELEDMSIEQQEAKILEWEELGASWAAYLGEKEEGYSNLLTTSEENIEAFAQTGVDAIEGSIERIITNEETAQKERELAAEKALETAKKNADKANKLLNDYWTNTVQTAANAIKEGIKGVTTNEDPSEDGKGITKNNKVNIQQLYDDYKKSPGATNEGFIKAQGDYETYQSIPNMNVKDFFKKKYGIDIGKKGNNKEDWKKYADSMEAKYIRRDMNSFVNWDQGLWGIANSKNDDCQWYTDNSIEARRAKEAGMYVLKYNANAKDLNDFWTPYATGGLVNYTGPAWVDGSPTKPEAFLSAEDTARIGEAAKILSDIPLLNSTSNAQNAVSSNIGDTSIEIHINVESVSSDYDVDQMIDRVKKDIIDVSKPTGTPVILKK